MEEAPENGKESPHSAHASGMNECIWVHYFSNNRQLIPSSYFKNMGTLHKNCLLQR